MFARLLQQWHNKPYRIWRRGHRVFVRELAPIAQRSDSDCRAYLAELSKAVRRTISSETWNLLTMPLACENTEYQAYVSSIREKFIREYRLEEFAANVTVAMYHGDVLVISLLDVPEAAYPRYYRGVQIKCMRTAIPATSSMDS